MNVKNNFNSIFKKYIANPLSTRKFENLTAYAVRNDNGWYDSIEMDESHIFHNESYYVSKSKAQTECDRLQKIADDKGYNKKPEESWDNYEVIKITIIV